MRTVKKYPCPCCKEFDFGAPYGGHDICEICGWEDDDYQIRYPNETGANDVSLHEAHKIWASGAAIWPDYPNPKQNRHVHSRRAYALQ